MTLNEAAVGTVATIGDSPNLMFIVKASDGSWRYVESGALVDDADFRGGWDVVN